MLKINLFYPQLYVSQKLGLIDKLVRITDKRNENKNTTN